MNRARRILMTADTVGGVWTYAMELTRALGQSGIEVALATMGALPTKAQRKEAAAIDNVELFESAYKLEWMERPWRDVAAAGDWLLELESRIEPDLIHLNSYAHGALPWRTPVVMVAHSCVLSWWRAVHGCDAPETEWRGYAEAVRRGLQAADFVVAPTAAMLSVLEEHYGPLDRTFHTGGRPSAVCSGGSSERRQSLPSKCGALTRRRYKQPRAATVISNGREVRPVRAEEKEPFILAAGRVWDEAKNIRALTAVAGELPWPVCVAGEGREPGVGRGLESEDAVGSRTGTRPSPPLLRLAARGAPPWGAVALGKLDSEEMTKWFSAAAIYALAAKYEPFGLSAVEAALCGCALVLGDIPSLREVWGDAAVFVPPNNTGILKSELLSLIHDRERRVEMANRALNVARQYTPERMAAGYLEVYDLLLEREAASAEAREVVACG